MPLHRRRFLQQGAALGIALAAPLQRLHTAHREHGTALGDHQPHGELRPVTDPTTGLEILKLPPDFSYRSFGWSGDPMNDGTPTPDRHDGMAVVSVHRGRGARPHDREFILIRNHERSTQAVGASLPLVGGGLAPVYDDYYFPGLIAGLGGGTTALRFGRDRLLDARATLGGTLSNCAGGPTPWHSWLTCEETTVRGSLMGGKDHGYVFEVPDPTRGRASGVPIRDMGLMDHEACAVDPRSGHVYLTEDNGPHSGFYRFRPHDTRPRFGALEHGGVLEMLRVAGEPGADLRNVPQGAVFPVEWVRIDEPEAGPEALEAPLPLFPAIKGSGRSGPYLQGEARGAARFSRGEGCWYHHGMVYFTDTNAGPVGKGVVWAYRPLPGNADAGELLALFVSPSADAADNPDNLTVSPRGGLLVCEDGGGEVTASGRRFGTRLLVITPAGKALVFAENNLILERRLPDKPAIDPDDYRGREFAGACFDPTGQYLFVNIQTPGLTIAITGPWQRWFL